MSIPHIQIKRRHEFIDELRLLKDIDEFKTRYLRNMAEQSERVFWEALHDICGMQSGEYIRQIAEKSVKEAEFGYKEIEGKQGKPMMAGGDVAQVMIQWYMIDVCARELAKYESRELYDRVTICVEQIKGYLESVIKSRADGLIQGEDNLH